MKQVEPTKWNWSPAKGRWKPDHGYPQVPTFFELSTHDTPARDRFALWQHIAYYEWHAIGTELPLDFQAKARALIGSETEFACYQSHGVFGERTEADIRRDGHDNISIGLVVNGSRKAKSRDDALLDSRRGQVFAYDAARPTHIRWSHHRGAHLLLRRPLLERALAGPVPQPSEMVRTLTRNAMYPYWRDRMLSLARHVSGLHPHARVFALGQLQSLTLFMLADRSAEEATSLYGVAIQMIRANFANPSLRPDWLAARLGCSRATLYRAFAEHETSVARAIADTRYHEARQVIAADGRTPIADIALRCGILDTDNFSRGFRQRFGISPSDVRAAVLRQKDDPMRPQD